MKSFLILLFICSVSFAQGNRTVGQGAVAVIPIYVGNNGSIFGNTSNTIIVFGTNLSITTSVGSNNIPTSAGSISIGNNISNGIPFQISIGQNGNTLNILSNGNTTINGSLSITNNLTVNKTIVADTANFGAGLLDIGSTSPKTIFLGLGGNLTNIVNDDDVITLSLANGYIRSAKLSVNSGTNFVQWTSGQGTPEGNIVAPVGSIYTRSDGSYLTTLYIKTNGNSSTGWGAK